MDKLDEVVGLVDSNFNCFSEDDYQNKFKNVSKEEMSEWLFEFMNDIYRMKDRWKE